MIHHPQKNIIEMYSVGELSTHIAVMISAHLEVCEECHASYRKILKDDSIHFSSAVSTLSNKDLDSAFDTVMDKLNRDNLDSKVSTKLEDISINVSGQLIHVPRSMNFLKDRQIPWKEFGKNNAIAPLVTSPKGNFYLIYIGPGESVPQHGHTGVEYSYVVAGSYDDGISIFSTGDFSLSTQKITHSPKATSEDGCLVVSWVEGRFNYFGGWLKPLNSILWWYLHRA